MRITPACAGNSNILIGKTSETTDHPRVCGEQKLAFVRKQANGGSPPRVRGTAYVYIVQQTLNRITPACAGNRQSLLDKKYAQ